MNNAFETMSDVLSARLHKPFDVTLTSRASSGYEWRPIYDSASIRLIRKRHRMKSKGFGAAGQEVFEFEPLQTGDHAITFELVRPVEGRSVEQRDFALHVT